MNLSLETVILIGMIFVIIDIVVIMKLFANRLKKLISDEKSDSSNNLFADSFVSENEEDQTRKSLDDFFSLNDSLRVNASTEDKIISSEKFIKTERKYIRKLNSIFWIDRVEASVKLGSHKTETARLALEKAL